ncbi:Fic family protein [uncultured Sphingomonas sp.]|uniref:Fic family protein n=2 Tax=Pseudomonadota TaxID=1224 RepID=UPI0030FCF38A
MDKQSFGASATGTLIATIGNRKAFVPTPLPPDLDLNPLAVPLAQASQAIGELKGIGRSVPNPMLLIRPLQRREAVSSSGMEGTYTTLSDLFLFEAGVSDAGRKEDNREVLNYVHALENAIQELQTLPISSRLMRNAHRLLLNQVARHRGATIDAGELKRDQNWIGGSGRIETARYIPPPPREAALALDNLAAYINREARNDMPPLVDAALAHYQFEAIHPFGDGNGRVGRMMITLMLMEHQVLPQPLLYMSPYLERHKDTYIDLMFSVSQKGEWVPWVGFFLEAVRESALGTIRVAERLQDLQRKYRERFQKAQSSALVLRIIDLAFERPARIVSDVAEELGVTYQGASNNIAKLLKSGVAQEIGSYPKVIIFPEILEALRLE